MKKIGTIFRETLEGDVKGLLKDADSIFIIKYAKLSSPDMTALRQSLKEANATLFVAKNSIVRRAFQEAKLEELTKFVEGPCGFIFAKGEPVDASRTLYNFRKEHENLALECGFIEDRMLEPKDIEVLAKLPGKDILRAQVVMTMKSPINGLVYALKQTLTKVVYCLDQIKNKKTN
ncbi:MAG: 50S ribosomal protein L10 [Candidatus Omnitrophota bacterium]|jgi:large subunit ribosomal protein L10